MRILHYIGLVTEMRFGSVWRFHRYLFKLVIYNESFLNKNFRLTVIHLFLFTSFLYFYIFYIIFNTSFNRNIFQKLRMIYFVLI